MGVRTVALLVLALSPWALPAGADTSCPGRAPDPGLHSFSLSGAENDREYAVYVPRGLEPTRRSAVVVDLHGSGSRPAQELVIDGLGSAADAEGFLVVLPVARVPFPQGGFTWNIPPDPRYGDDARFVVDVLDAVSRRFCVDSNRVYLTGFSGGARLASRVACLHGHRFAAMAAVGGLRGPGGCSGVVPVIAVHGTDDPINPFAGGGPSYWGHGVDEAVEGWAESNGCTVGPTTELLGDGVETQTYGGCRDGAEVVLYRLEGTGHVWPGSDFDFPRARFGEVGASLEATRTILDFFRRFAPADEVSFKGR